MAEGLRTIDPLTLKTWLQKGEAVLIDVREQDEYKDEHIKSSTLVPLSTFDPSQIDSSQLSGPTKKKLVFHCAGGKRSEKAALKWLNSHPNEEAYNLIGGIHGWKDAGFTTEKNS